jgi:hypothetical protein
MRTLRILVFALALAPLAVAARAQSGPPDRFQFEVRLGVISIENLFQAPAGSPEADVRGSQGELRFNWNLGAAGATALYLRAGHTEYSEELESSQSYVLGLKGRKGWHGFDVQVEHANDRPSVEADEFDQADVTRATLLYELFPTSDWQITLRGEAEQQSYARALGQDNDYSAAGVALRYRGFGRAFSPEVGYLAGNREVDRASSSHDIEEYWVRIISSPARGSYFALRYRVRQRDYTIDDPASRNFGRRDDREQWSLTAAVDTGRYLQWGLYYSRESSESTRPGVDFDTSLAVLTVTLRFY